MHSALPHKLRRFLPPPEEELGWDLKQDYPNIQTAIEGEKVIQHACKILCNELNCVMTQITDKLCLIFRRFYTHLSIYWERLKLMHTVQWNDDDGTMCVRW